MAFLTEMMSRLDGFQKLLDAAGLAKSVRVPTYTCNDTCIALSERVQRHL
jgi:hypothetical protein